MKARDNNALERTRRVGVPATRAVVRVSPRRSTQCCAYGGAISRGIALAVLLTLSAPREADPQDSVVAVPRPPAKAPVKGARALETWALAASETQPIAVIKQLHELLADPDKEVRVAAAWAIGHLRVTETGEEAQAYDEAPRLERQSKPVYPLGAYSQRIQGTVQVDFVIDEGGRVAHAEVRKSISPLDRAAVACVKDWRFRPAKLLGRTIPVRAVAPISFTIDK